MNRATLNGLQPRDMREVSPDPWDWTDAPLFEAKPSVLTVGEVALIVVSVVCSVIALAYKFAGPT